MRAARAIVRLVALVAVTLVAEILWVIGLLPARVLGRASGWRAGIFRSWSRWVLAILSARVEVAGRAPSPPFLLVSNHLSYLDIVVFAGETGAAFVSKSEVASWPVMGWLARSMGTIFVDRRLPHDVVRVGEAMGRTIDSGRGLVLFPEGTSTSGRDVLPFRPSLLAPAAKEGWEVHHASIRYVTEEGDPPARQAVAWWGDMTFGPHIWTLLSLRGVRARIVFGEDPIVSSDRKSLARRLHRAVGEHFEPLVH